MPPYHILVSVLVPTYQQEQFIEQCLRSIIQQRINFDIEILVGDDCSSDTTAEVIENIAKLDERVVLNQWPQNEGGLKNIDKLLARAQGRYIAILEGDDYWLDPEHLAKSVVYLEQHPNCIFTSANYLHSIDDLLVQKQKLFTKVKRPLHFWHLALGNFIQMGTLIYRRPFYPRVPSCFIDLPLGDYPLILSLLNNGSGMYLNHTAMAYRVHSNGVWSGQPSVIQAERTLTSLEAFLKKNSTSLLRVALVKAFEARLQLHTLPAKFIFLNFSFLGRLLIYLLGYTYRKAYFHKLYKG
jgi:glycosyltransferase involved in cell wall biosynthesis